MPLLPLLPFMSHVPSRPSRAMNSVLSCRCLGQEIDAFKVKYVGSVPVKASRGNDICKNAVDRLRSLRLREKPILLKVTTLGLYLIDPKTADVVKEVNIRHVTFVAQDVLDDKLVWLPYWHLICFLTVV